MWAAKFAARHQQRRSCSTSSSFKCGHDAPTYGIIDDVVQTKAGAPYSALHDVDANKPGGSIKIRIKTYNHTLKPLPRAPRRRSEEAQLEFKRTSIDEKKLELIELKQELTLEAAAREAGLAA